MKICGFAICRLTHLRNLWIRYSGMSQEFADLQIKKLRLLASLGHIGIESLASEQIENYDGPQRN
jgi:hypothetical protein